MKFYKLIFGLGGIIFLVSISLCADIAIEDYSFVQFVEPNPAQIQRDQGSATIIVEYSYLGVFSAVVEATARENLAFDDDESVYIEGPALIYPNPASLSETNGVIQIGYRLSKEAEIELRLYDIRGNHIHKEIFAKNSLGGQRNYNRVPLDLDAMGLGDLPSSVYFYLVMHNGKVIEKGKFVLMP